MNYTVPFDLKLGNSISPECTSILCSFFDKDNIHIIDIKQFQKEKGYTPCISSNFIVSNGGSYNYVKNGKNISIYNGTLTRIQGYPQLWDYMCEYTNRIFQ